MTLAGLSKTKASRVMGIDASTHSLAYCIFWNKRPIRWGKINFSGADVFERIADAASKVEALRAEFEVDFISMEGAILANNRNVDVTIKLSLMYGAILSELLKGDAKVIQVKPLLWQNYIENKTWTKAQKEALKREIPGKSAAWYSTEIRRRRKRYTIDYFNDKFPYMELDDDDVADACGIGWHSYNHLTTH